MLWSTVSSFFRRLHSIVFFYCILFVFPKPFLCWAPYNPSNDVTVAMLFPNKESKERAAMLVPQTNPSRIELFFYAKSLFWFCFGDKCIWPLFLRLKITCRILFVLPDILLFRSVVFPLFFKLHFLVPFYYFYFCSNIISRC